MTADTYLYEKQSELGRSEVAQALINKLPDDVLSYIFILHCREKTDTVRLPFDPNTISHIWSVWRDVKTDTVRLPFNRSNVPPQITISHVCSVWRDVILNMLSFWNDLEVFMDDTKDGDMLMKVVHDWLFRARDLPCSLTLDFRVDDRTFGIRMQERWYSGIVKHLISQFRFRKLSMPWSSNHWTQFLQLPAEKLSCIEDLHICCINPPSISNFDPFSSEDGFKKLITFTSLRLDQSLRRGFYHVVYSEDPLFAHVPWHQLRHIHLTIPMSISLCFTILQCSSMVLETCSFVVSERYGPWTDIQSLYAEPLYCPQLRTLDLEARLHSDRSHYPPILDLILLRIRMPNLKTLVVSSSDQSSQSMISLSTLVAMQDVSNMQLEEFGFYQHHCDMYVGDLVRVFPSLKRVEVLGRTILNNDTLGQLGSGFIGPCIEDLIIKCCDIDLGKLLRMVKVRSSIGELVNRDEWQVENKPTSFRYVNLYRWEATVPEEYKESIE